MTTVAENIRGRPSPYLHRVHGSDPRGRAWLTRAPQLADEMSVRWGLDTGRPMPSSSGFVLPAHREGQQMLLKVFRRPQAARHERSLYAALPDISPFVFASEGRRGVLLMERVIPGFPVGDRDRLRKAGRLLTYMKSQVNIPSGLPDLALQVRGKQMGLSGDLWPGAAVRQAALDSLSAGPRRVLHGRFVPEGGVVRSREGWVLVSPRPALGDPAYDAACWAICDQMSGSIADNCALLSRYSGLDEERVREVAWAVVALEKAFAGRDYQARLQQFIEVSSSDPTVRKMLSA